MRAQALRPGSRHVGYSWALGRALGARFARLGDDLRVDAITLVRDPVARAVSAVFQSPELARVSGVSLAGAQPGELDVKRTVAWIAESIGQQGAADYPERWLARELLPVLGVDVFAHAFDRARGYRIIEGPRGRVLLLRTEDLDRRLGAALQDFYGLGHAPTVQRSNVRRGLRADYGEVLEQLRLPESLVDRIYAGRFARHFYAADEIETFRGHWCRPAGV